MNKIFTAQPIALPEDLVDPTGLLYEDVYITKNSNNNGVIEELKESGKFYIRGRYISKDDICIDSVDIMVDPNTAIDATVYCGIDFANSSDITYCNGDYIEKWN